MWMQPPFVSRIRKSRRSKEKISTNRKWSRQRDERQRMKIGFIGLSLMGSSMAAKLQKQGHSLVACNRTRDQAAILLGPFGQFADSPAEVARQGVRLLT